MEKLKSEEAKYALPGSPLTPEEMESMVKRAEQGKFHSMYTVKQKIAEWKKAKYVKS